MQRYAEIFLVVQLFFTFRGEAYSYEGFPFIEFSIAERPMSVMNSCRSLPDWTLLADPTDCRKYHACVGKTSEEFECAEDYHFDPHTLHCVPGECPLNLEVACHNHEALPVLNDCYKFTYCVAGKRELRECPKNYYFDSETKICQKITNSPDFQCQCGIRSSHATFANAANCATYYRCVNDRSMLNQCPLGQYFNESINSCLQDYDGKCMKPDNSTFCKGIGDGFRAPLFQALSGDCTKFKMCIFGKIFIQQCRHGLFYDPEVHYCRHSRDHKCHESASKWVEEHKKVNKNDGDKKHSSHATHNHIYSKHGSTEHAKPVKPMKPIKTNSKSRYDKFSSRFAKY